MDEKQPLVQTLLTRDYKYIQIVFVPGTPFKELRYAIENLDSYEDTLFILKRRGEGKTIHYYAYDYFQRKKSFEELKPVEPLNIDTIPSKKCIQIPGPEWVFAPLSVETIISVDENTKPYVNANGYPHNYFSRMRKMARKGNLAGIGLSIGSTLIGGILVLVVTTLSLSNPVILSLMIAAVVLFVGMTMGILLARAVGALAGALSHYREKSRSESQREDVSLLKNDQPLELTETDKASFKPLLTTAPTAAVNYNDAEDTFTGKEFYKALVFRAY